MLHMKWFRKPKIWMLTGLYLLKDAKTFTISSKGVKGSGDVEAIQFAKLIEVPVGGTVTVGSGNPLEANFSLKGSYVWAAQYHLLDVRYIRMLLIILTPRQGGATGQMADHLEFRAALGFLT
jgi:hypothetical protein